MQPLEKFRSILSTILAIPESQITDDLSPDSLDTWDSLNHINLISALEQEFNLHLPAANLADHQSVSKLKSLLAEHGINL